MGKTFQKLFFLGIVVLVGALGGRWGAAKQAGNLSGSWAVGPSGNYLQVRQNKTSDSEPLFVLSSPSKIITDATAPVYSFSQTSAANGQTGSPPASGINEPAGDGNSAQGAYLEAAGGPKEEGFKRRSDAPAPNIEAQAVLLADLETGQRYFELNSVARWPMASITKLVAAVKALENIDPASRVTFGTRDFPGGGTAQSGSPPGAAEKPFRAGDTYTAKDLLTAMLLSSSNEAAEALANYYGRENFISGMNAIVRGWGLSATIFSDPTGLSPVNQSTAQDLLRLTSHLYAEYPEILITTRALRATIRELNSNRLVSIANINLLARRRDFLGGKTGFIDAAKGNLLTVFFHQGRPVVSVVLGTDDRFAESEKLINWFEATYTKG